MKKTFLFAVMMMAVLSAKAQLCVDSVGKVHAIGELLAEGGFTFQNLSGQTNLRLIKSQNGITTRSYNLITESHANTSSIFILW